MATYLVLNLCVLAIVAAAGLLMRRLLRFRPVLVASSVLLLLTAIFDNGIILAKIVAYDPSKISGIHVGVVPVEDFAYCLAAGLLMPLIWNIVKGKS